MDGLCTALGIGYPHPRTGEYVLTYAELLRLLQYIKENECAVVLGGDVLNEKDQYLYANWWYNSDDALSQTENIHRSCDEAMRYVKSLSAPQEKHYIAVLTNRETGAGALFA